MKIRKAKEKDIEKITELLSQVLEIHAKIRPDIFISGTTKYTPENIADMLYDDAKPVFVAVDGNDCVLGYAFCVFEKQSASSNTVPFLSLYIDDFCVDEKMRGQGIGTKLFEYIKQFAKDNNCYEITLNVWEGNISARKYYDRLGMKPKKTHLEYIL